MTGDTQLVFPPFTLDVANQSLWRGGEKLLLRSKSLAVLTYLAKHPHRLVTKEELMEAVWPGAKVVEAALRVSIAEIRKALGDNPAKPKYIETVGKNGYRFLAAIGLKFTKENGAALSNFFVGRTAELGQLRHHREIARGGKRQVVLITGEPGIGKTTLIDVFTNHLTRTGEVVIARGQCIEQYGAGEAFLPVLDALEQLCRTGDSEATIDSLRRLATSWLIDLPTLISPLERESLARQCLEVTPERRLREIAAFLEEIAKDRTMVLILEDLHWLDPSTLALISLLARRREAARLMLIGTYRGGEVERLKSPLKTVAAELEMHKFCVHLPLKLLNRSAVEEYLAARFDNPAVSSSVISTVYARSEGNPLFMVNVTDHLVARGAVVQEYGSVELANETDENTTPSAVRELIERQLEALPAADQELLKTASVAGMNFSTAAVAAALDVSIEQIEIRCDRLAKQEQFLQCEGMNRWPDGTVGARYAFAHALYQNVIYESVLASRKARLHQSVGERTEAAYQGATDQVAAELALHFERAGDYGRATRYLTQAAQISLHSSAYQEAIDYAEAGLRLAKSIPETAVRQELELQLEINLGSSIAATKGYATSEAREIFTRATLLSGNVDDASLAFQALIGL